MNRGGARERQDECGERQRGAARFIWLRLPHADVTRRRRVHSPRRDHGHAPRPRRLPVGPRTDHRHAQAVRARRDVRGARRDRPPRSRGSLRGAGRFRLRGGVSRAARVGSRALHDRRLDPERSRTSWCAAIRTSSRATPGEPALDSAGQVRTRWEEIKAQERGARRRAEDAAQRHRGDAACAAARVSHRHAGGVGRLRLGATPTTSWRRFRRRWTNCARSSTAGPADPTRAEEEMGDLLFAMAQPVAQARDRARDRAAEGERQVHAAVRSTSNAR